MPENSDHKDGGKAAQEKQPQKLAAEQQPLHQSGGRPSDGSSFQSY